MSVGVVEKRGAPLPTLGVSTPRCSVTHYSDCVWMIANLREIMLQYNHVMKSKIEELDNKYSYGHW